MCGIVYAHDFEGNPVNNGVLNQFDKQRSRGVRGFGVFDGKHIVRAKDEDKILKWLVNKDSDLLLFHHRFPTSTINTKNTAHPFSTGKYFGKHQYILVHNGHISNSWGLKSAHEDLKIRYSSELSDKTFNDSEALLWDVALYLEGKQTGLNAVGGMAFVCVKLTDGKLDKLFFGRNSNPLNMFRVPQGLMLSSEGVGEPIDANHLYTWNYRLKRLTSKFLSIPSSSYTSSVSYPEYDEPISRAYPEGSSMRGYLLPPTPDRSWDRLEYEEDDERFWQSSDQEIRDAEHLAYKYLMKHEGVFEIAYTELEADYMIFEQDNDTSYDTIRLYELAMECLNTDPEYQNEKSVSSTWTQLTLA